MNTYATRSARYSRSIESLTMKMPLDRRATGHSRYSAHCGDPESVIIERFASVSFIVAMNDANKARVLGQLRALVATHPALRGRSLVEFPYKTHAYCCRRLPSSLA
jgi:hypothetical protein